MNQKLLSGVLIFSLALNLAIIGTFVYHRFIGPDFPPPEFRKERQNRFFRALDIPAGKREKLFKLMKSFRAESRPLQKKIFQNEQNLLRRIEDDKSNANQINTILDTLAALRLRQSKQAITHFLKVRNFLTLEEQHRLFGMILRLRPPQGGMMRPFMRFKHPNRNDW